ncbi:hypothetical protein GCM10010923_20170 [Blastomonas marina]|uniref:Metal-dependent phosphohydrolase 7TM extracellular domain-containing protein n=1 Tax=Blastomonas marina TaxID=1867408 RepID=A0ABQ1FGK9_9SPHN|nr:hypothetical protein [Blastomonas marina]GGA09710.1 hypothetical protein GCM10010923_20170 [Blastomonas marina]
MGFIRNVNPVGAIEDFRQVYKVAGKNRWRFMALAAAITFTLFGTMAQERAMIPPERPEIEIISTLAPGRTDAEIVASNIANQERKDRLVAEQAARNEEVKEIYRSLGRMSGIDVDAVEAEAEAERARVEAQRAEARRILAQRQAEAYEQIEE